MLSQALRKKVFCLQAINKPLSGVPCLLVDLVAASDRGVIVG